MPKLRNSSQGRIDCESDILQLSYHAPHKSTKCKKRMVAFRWPRLKLSICLVDSSLFSSISLNVKLHKQLVHR